MLYNITGPEPCFDLDVEGSASVSVGESLRAEEGGEGSGGEIGGGGGILVFSIWT